MIILGYVLFYLSVKHILCIVIRSDLVSTYNMFYREPGRNNTRNIIPPNVSISFRG